MPGLALKLVVGLGNPGREYESTRHNAGFWFVDALARKLGASFAPQAKFHGEVARDGELRLVKPMTYMNESGRTVGALARFLGIAPGEILVVHDELDLPAGGVKMKLGGGVAGHNGSGHAGRPVGRELVGYIGGADRPGDGARAGG